MSKQRICRVTGRTKPAKTAKRKGRLDGEMVVPVAVMRDGTRIALGAGRVAKSKGERFPMERRGSKDGHA
jgi:hypothetical protein